VDVDDVRKEGESLSKTHLKVAEISKNGKREDLQEVNAATLLEQFATPLDEALTLLEEGEVQSPYPVRSSCFSV